MVNQQLVDYIKQSRQSGVEDSAIRQALLGSGYSVQDIEEGLNQNASGLGLEQLSPKSRFSFKFPRKLVKILAIFVIVLVAVIGGYFALANYFPQYAKYVQPYLGPVLDPVMKGVGLTVTSSQNINELQVNPSSSTSSEQFVIPADWKTYQSTFGKFEFKYPGNNWDIKSTTTEVSLNLSNVPEKMLLDIYIKALGSNPPFSKDSLGIQSTVNQYGLKIYKMSDNRVMGSLLNNKEYQSLVITDDYDPIVSFLYNKDHSVLVDQIVSTFRLIDSDADGLSDVYEVRYGAILDNPDTDSDGYPDGEEVQNGYNPLGPGKILSTDSLIRNKKRIEDINNIRGAINLYFEDHKYFPPNIESATLKGNLIADIRTDPVTSKSYHYSYYPNDKSIGYHLWAELENNHTLALKADSDINSNQSGWAGDKIDASKTDAEICISSYDNGTARDCIYDVGEYDVYKYGFKNNFYGNPRYTDINQAQNPQSRNTQRWDDINNLLYATFDRVVDNKGVWNTDTVCKALPFSITEIGTGNGRFNLRPCLVPAYLSNIDTRFDPSNGSEISTGYTIVQSSDGKITISAPHAELGETIFNYRPFEQ